jgi:hypothetical protein
MHIKLYGRKQHKGKLQNSYSLLDYSQDDQAMENEMGGHIACIREKLMQILTGKLKQRDNLEDQGTNHRIILKCI